MLNSIFVLLQSRLSVALVLCIACPVLVFPRQQGSQEKVSTYQPPQIPQDIRKLEAGMPVEREMIGGELHAYEITLATGQYLNVVADQRGIDVKVTVIGPDGRLLFEFNNESGKQGQETVTVVAEASGSYRLNVQPVDKRASTGRYEIRAAELRTATERDRLLQEARKRYDESVKLGSKGQIDVAIRLGEQALAIRENALGSDHLDVARALNNLGILYAEKGEYAKAEPLFLRALAIREKALGPDHPDVAPPLTNLARLYSATGDYAKAEPLYQRTLAIREKALGPDHLNVATSLNNLANLYREKGEYAKAEPLFQRALAIREKALGPDHPDVAASLNNLANLYVNKGEYAKAEPLYLRDIVITEKVLGPDHPELARSLNNLAILYREKGDYAKAEPLFQRAIAIKEKALGSDHHDVAASLDNLANLYFSKGDYARAEPLYQRAIVILEKALGSDHPELARSLSNLASLYSSKGDYAKAEPLLQRAIAITEKTLGPDHPELARSLSNLANLYYYSKGGLAKAEPLYQRAIMILEKVLGPDHPDVAASLNNLAMLYREKGDYAKAEPLYQRAIAITEKALGPDHPDVAVSLNSLANLYREEGDFAKAEPLFRRAIAITEKALGPDNPDIALSLDSLAILNWDKGESAKAIAYLSRAVRVSERDIALNVASGSEREKLLYLSKLSEQVNLAITFHVRSFSRDAAARDLAVTTILQRKGRVLDAMTDSIAALRRRANPQDVDLIDRLTDNRSRLAKLVLGGPGKGKPAEYQAEIKRLEEMVEELEATISRRSAEFRAQSQPVSLEAVQTAIPFHTALVEFILYRPRNPKAQKGEQRHGAARYVAYVLGHKGKAKWVELGEARPIDDAINTLRAVLRKDEDRPLSNVERDVKPLARKVDQLVGQPVRRLLGKTRQVFISPDGALNLIPFAALVDEKGHYLVERYHFTYLTSGRDLLRLQEHLPSKQGMLIIANPDYGPMSEANGSRSVKGGKVQVIDKMKMPAEPNGIISSTAVDFSQIEFPPLEGTEQEARALKLMMPEAAAMMREQATKTAIQQANAPSMLHVATHGFFLEDVVTGPSAMRVKNPLLRSGLALAGANLHKTGEDNGILTALEVSGVNLWGTKLVVLSACETGLGDVNNGEGIYGLRRALVLAGAESQMLSLWKVDDAATRDLMIDYYTRLKAGVGRSEGLRQVQLKMLATPRYQHPYFWASFIESGEWANLDGKR